MKTSSEWSQVWFDYKTKKELCQAIQADALRHAAEIANQTENKDFDFCDWESEISAYKTGRRDASDKIMDESKRVAKMPNGQKLSHAASDIRQPETRSANGQA